jgi:hypothetical protein
MEPVRPKIRELFEEKILQTFRLKNAPVIFEKNILVQALNEST